MIKIFVTGATGFIGRNILPMLDSENVEVACLIRPQSQPFAVGNLKIKKIEGTLEDLTKCKSQIREFNPDVCLHLAWEGIPDYSHKTSKKNLDQSIALVNFLLDETTCRKIVVSGSCFEYGKALGRLSEENPEENNSAIAWAKNSLKNYISLRADEKKVDWMWMRVFYAFGPGQREQSLIPSLVLAARKGLPSPIRNPHNANDFVYIEDVARAFVLACTKKANSGVYNLGSGALFKVSDIWTLVQESVSKSLSGPTTLVVNEADSVGGFANIEKVKNELDWTPQWRVQEAILKFTHHLIGQEAL